jgi:hypothetical protein
MKMFSNARMKAFVVAITILLFVVILLFSIYPVGTYASENTPYKVKLQLFGKCTWIQGSNSYFEGTYKREDKGYYILMIEGSGYYLDTRYTAQKVGNSLIIDGGYLIDERFVKE